ncbi:MAG: leucyl/phenylalanyl-tRNA--protein transferase, partial [Proteobacteria bacterium]|nr:leucyl/phenylalanyl-tRNA--protein transferase [Pseudomonadota bacterium]
LGYAHSVECWRDGALAGGLYGISLGGMFFGESMFSKTPNSSKAALAILCHHLAAWGFDCIDCQMRTEHLISIGAKEIGGREFFTLLQKSILRPDHHGKWQIKRNGSG